MSLFWINYTFRMVFLLFLTLKPCMYKCLKLIWIRPSFEAVQFLESRLRLWKLSVFVQFPLLELFVKNSNRIQVLHQSYLAIFLSRQKVNLLRNWTKEKHRSLAFMQQMTCILYKLIFAVSVLLLIIKISQSVREKWFSYCKITNYWYTKVGLWLIEVT